MCWSAAKIERTCSLVRMGLASQWAFEPAVPLLILRALSHLGLVLLLLMAHFRVAQGAGKTPASILDRNAVAARLRAAYPDFVVDIEGNDVVFQDGTRLPFDDGRAKTIEEWQRDPDIKDMFRFSYPRGAPATAPARHFDPGRARNENFFRKIYGDCSKPEFSKTLTQITWLPGKTRQKLVVTTVNGVAEKLKAISSELDALPARFDEFLVPSAGAFICRHIAGTDQRSAHGYGIAVDIALKRSHYWRWDRSGSDRALRYRNDTARDRADF